jgi:hypothetical protein
MASESTGVNLDLNTAKTTNTPTQMHFPEDHARWDVHTNVSLNDGNLWKGKFSDDDAGPLLQEIKAEQSPEWRDISDRGPIYKSY